MHVVPQNNIWYIHGDRRENNKDRFAAFTQIENIVVIGHSLSQVDYLYFKEIIKYNNRVADINWHIVMKI